METNEIINADCLDEDVGLPSLPDECVDMILTDPAYPTLEEWRGVGSTARLGLGREGTDGHDPDKFFETVSWEGITEIVLQLHRLLKPVCHAYIMVDSGGLYPMLEICHDSPFVNVKPLVWDKTVMGMGYHYRAQHEYIIMLDKEKNRRLNDLGVADVLSYKAPSHKERICPTQKPLALFRKLVEQSSDAGELVLDPFIGGGTTAMACEELGRDWIGYEIDPEMFEKAQHRMNQKQPRLV